jgi:glycosyltransferase involved in cell wall biosynthesis
MAILEGMAAGLPWIATSVGAVPLAIRDEVNGLLIAPDNSEVLANTMTRMMKSPEERFRMGAAASRLIESDFSAERMAGDYLGVYSAAKRENKGPLRDAKKPTTDGTF